MNTIVTKAKIQKNQNVDISSTDSSGKESTDSSGKESTDSSGKECKNMNLKSFHGFSLNYLF